MPIKSQKQLEIEFKWVDLTRNTLCDIGTRQENLIEWKKSVLKFEKDYANLKQETENYYREQENEK